LRTTLEIRTAFQALENGHVVVLAVGMQLQFTAMKDIRRHHRLQRVLLLCLLVLLATAERRLAYLDFDVDSAVQLENQDKPDGDEIINRLVFVDDAKEPIAPTAGDICHAAAIPLDSSARSLFVAELAESRAPPLALPSHA